MFDRRIRCGRQDRAARDVEDAVVLPQAGESERRAVRQGDVPRVLAAVVRET